LEELQKRLTKDSVSQRPLFFGMNTGEITLKLKDMMAIRGLYYDQAKIKLSGEDLSTELLMSELMGFFRN
jgi:shikimate kinase